MSQRVLVFLTGLLLLTALGSYVYYRHREAQVPVDPWALVPDDAVLVTATRDHPTLVRHLKETQLWDNLTAVRYFQQVEDNLALADSVVGGREVVLRFLGRKRVFTSVHVTGPGQFDILFQVPISSVREYRLIRNLVEGLGRDKRFEVTTREFHDQQLTQVRQRSTGEGLTVLNYRNHLLISANPALVEAVALRLEHPGQPTVAADFQSTDYFRLKDVDATLLLNQRRLPQLLSVFFRQDLGADLAEITSLAKNELVQMKLAGNKVVFDGFANVETARNGLHQRLRGQPAQRLSMAEVVPMKTALLVHFGLGQATALRGKAPATPDTLAAATGPLLDSIATLLRQEVALCYLGTSSARQRPGKLALAWCSDPARLSILLGQLRRATGTSPSFERVGPYQQYQMQVPELPHRLLGPLFQNFPQPVVAQVGNYVAFGENDEVVRQWLQSVAAGEVWSRSPTQVAFLQDTQPMARLSILLDMGNAWNVLLRGLVEERRAGLLRNESLFKRFPQVAMQWVPAANEAEAGAQYFTHFVLRHPAEGPAVARPQNQDGTGSLLTFKTPLQTSPTLVTVGGAKLPGVLVQDTAHVLHYITPDNVVAWSDTLPGPLVGSPYRMPGATGFLVASATQLFGYNSQGKPLPNFPFNLPDTLQATSLTVSPPGGNQPQRLLVAGSGSNLFLYNTQGRIFTGWQPRQLEFRLAAPPHYLTVNGLDVIVVLLENGYIYAYNQAGGVYPGFPISVGARMQSKALVETGSSLRRTRLTVVTQHGERVSFNLSGDIVARGRIATWSRNSVFHLVPDQEQRTYVVVREEGGRLALFDATGRQLLSQTFITSAPKQVQYFNFGAGRQVYAITEQGPSKAYLYDAKLRLLGGQPFDSTVPQIALDYNLPTATYHLFRVVGSELRRTDLKLD
ncbi:hypothetical protein SAMN06265337_1094 [Hymenobacter gelipurpurascens]|uniref:Outer membrane protein assembly factor BamB, contains PQQ-like beta-propeller repeat n=1 Tax=Hymenobacter gelipurpurascens TaxID=89968 RepID=A0A212TF47_9BACT|nr:hypothetical protein [Hymenobacter gelipurpurascens]SNC64510.1 hypothetical protein SAMN06265337_1094 [Hymenobacter gelipurpurascens]